MNEQQLSNNLKQKYIEMYDCMMQKDIQKLASLLDVSFVLVHMTGMRQSKEEYLHYIEKGTLNYYSAKHENISVEINDNTAVLTGQSRVNAAVFGGGKNLWRLQQKILFKQIKDKWYMVEAVVSTY